MWSDLQVLMMGTIFYVVLSCYSGRLKKGEGFVMNNPPVKQFVLFVPPGLERARDILVSERSPLVAQEGKLEVCVNL